MFRTRSRVGLVAGLLTCGLAVGLLDGAEALAVAGPTPDSGASFGFVVQINAGGRGCTGALISEWWIITAANCFADPGQPLQEGPPSKPATVTVGRPDLTTGRVVAITTLVPRTDRNLVLAQLATAITDVTPVALATTPAATNQSLTVAGYGRTATEWVPNKQHTAKFTVQDTTATTFALTGATPDAAICKGDAGGPALRDAGGHPELVGLNHTSWQHGCYTETTTRQGATETRTDDITTWISQNQHGPWNGPDVKRIFSADLNGDGKADIIKRGTDGNLYAYQNINGLSSAPTFAAAKQIGSGWNDPTVVDVFFADLNGDGKAELIKRTTTGYLVAWPNIDGITGNWGAYRNIGSDWNVPTVVDVFFADLNADGKAELIKRTTTGYLVAWPNIDGITGNWGAYRNIGSAWNDPTVVDVFFADLNADGKAELIKRTTTGYLVAWPNNDGITGNWGAYRNIGSDWNVPTVVEVFLADLNGDHKAELINYSTSGDLVAWPNIDGLNFSWNPPLTLSRNA